MRGWYSFQFSFSIEIIICYGRILVPPKWKTSSFVLLPTILYKVFYWLVGRYQNKCDRCIQVLGNNGVFYNRYWDIKYVKANILLLRFCYSDCSVNFKMNKMLIILWKIEVLVIILADGLGIKLKTIGEYNTQRDY